MTEDIAITFETLYDILRREKSREELQELKPSFFEDVVRYLKEKQNSLLSSGQESLFAGDDKIQHQNIRRIIRDIYDLREKKIISLARDVSRTGTNLINMKALLAEEEEMYKDLLLLFDRYRTGVLNRVLLAEDRKPKTENELNALKTENRELSSENREPKTEPTTLKRKVKSEVKTVLFLEQVPQFVGPDLETIGPFNQGDKAELPEKVVQALLNKKSVELI
jgi:DNA replication initiation complex subunit (GINS family)